MQSGNATLVPEKMHGGGGGEAVAPPPHQQQWFMGDERDGFISWLRGEFAAANAIIDALCHHLRLVGEQPGEYDGVIGCVQQRRGNWSTVLHMQQYFSVAEVIYALHQVEWRKQQKGGFNNKRNGGGSRGGGGGGGWRSEGHNFSMDANSKEFYSKSNGVGKIDVIEKEIDVKQGEKKGSWNVENESRSSQVPNEKQNVTIVPKTFVATEICDGKPVNVVDGMKLYEELLSSSEVSKLVTLVNDLRASGRRGQLSGK
uniref:Uncharacterized protein isoform X2 n=1 Tax=Nicotiana tabacum TaxID=4097 RepID=A0A1S4B3W8_TOBAC|nr:PREDICTED: uncharacterized protein LOC107804155 isoform X2 [Nicotiana tabacum]